MAETSNRMQWLCSTICVASCDASGPRSFAEASSLFQQFGDLACIDLSAGFSAGNVLVTFWDSRSAEHALRALGVRAAWVHPTERDYHAVKLTASEIPRLSGIQMLAGIETFGEIATSWSQNGDIVVELFDLRAAREVVKSIPACHPWHPSAVNAEARLMGAVGRAGAGASQQTPDHYASPSITPSVRAGPLAQGYMHEASVSGGGSSHVVAHGAPPPTRLAGSTPVIPGIGGVMAPLNSAQAAAVPAGVWNARRTEIGSSDRPFGQQSSPEQRDACEIVPSRIYSGEELRTTVVVCGIPRTCKREDLVQLMLQSGLHGSCNFLHLPAETSNSTNTHCGSAFVDLQVPADVLKLHAALQSWWLPGGPQHFSLSYARLQGQRQLMDHFRMAAECNQHDVGRPEFCQQGSSGVSGSIQASSSSNVADRRVQREPGEVGKKVLKLVPASDIADFFE